MSTAIVTLLGTLQLSSAAAFADIKEYPTVNFEGIPAVTVIPSDNISDYATITQNLRTYAFFIDIFYPVEGGDAGVAGAFTVMRQLVDLVLYALDNSNNLNGTNQYADSLSSICDMIRPVPSSWAMVQSGAGDLLSARITLQCAKTVSTDNG
jgi:hypothetical protein